MPKCFLVCCLEAIPKRARRLNWGVYPNRVLHRGGGGWPIKDTRNPNWWNERHESAWDRIKAAFKRDWDQTKHDFGARQSDTNQDVDDTVKQAVGQQPVPPRGEPTYEEAEDAYRFGYGARSQYGSSYAGWDDQLEQQLEHDWTGTYSGREWNRFRDLVRRGWSHEDEQKYRRAA